MQTALAETGLTITNPLVLYRALVATKKIEPDPAQHRLAIHLQKLYHRLKDYEPSIEYRHRLEKVTRTIGPSASSQAAKRSAGSGDDDDGAARGLDGAGRGLWGFITRQKTQADSLALTRTMTSHDAALQMDSPQGLLLYGEVGTGKSFLVDLLAESLPSRKKRRYHFNAFMLDTFARLEQQRIERSARRGGVAAAASMEQEHTLLSLARDMVTTSPILFLDEFQLPDRASSKILSNLFTSFFHLGGVLIATSNRMPEELSKASGIELAPPATSSRRLGLSGLGRLFGVPAEDVGKGMFARQSDFAQFLEVLKARCETWNMESTTDFRRRASSTSVSAGSGAEDQASMEFTDSREESLGRSTSSMTGAPAHKTDDVEDANEVESALPAFFFHKKSDLLSDDSLKAESIWHACVLQAASPGSASLDEIPWQTENLSVYGREVQVPKAAGNACMWTFDQLCGTYLGPADYITLTSTYRTVIVDEVPVLNFLQKNEARRFITLLDALYEARCRLLIRAEAGPDHLFFPDARGLNGSGPELSAGNPRQDSSDDGVYAETLSEIYQDQTVPFRPNISSYSGNAPQERTFAEAVIREHGAHPATRSVLADEDADFGPVYGAGRSAGASSFDPAEEDRKRLDALQSGPNFQQPSAFTGEDEKFAYKRAESRLWELCSRRWWDSALETSWWKPLSKEARSWEKQEDIPIPELDASDRADMEQERDRLFRHGASPFRTHQDPPPNIPWTHTWGMMKWGRKAGKWGQGAEAAEERLEEKRREKEMLERIQTKPRP